jgi:hypothetical protein
LDFSHPTGLNTARGSFSRLQELQTAALAFGGTIHLPLQEQQKNMMEQLGQHLLQV